MARNGDRCKLIPLATMAFGVVLATAAGCATHSQLARSRPSAEQVGHQEVSNDRVVLTSHVEDADERPTSQPTVEPIAPAPPTELFTSNFAPDAQALVEWEAQAVVSNPSLIRLRQQVAAARARANYVGSLPDPTLGANVFAHPIETAAGSQRSNLTLAQMVPWLARLDAQTQQACFEAMALEQEYELQRLKVIGDLHAGWYRLYVLDEQLRTTRANQQLLQSLIETAAGTVGVGRASPSDVRLATVEYSRLQEQILTLQQQIASTKAELNRLVGRPAYAPINGPRGIEVSLPDWSHELLRQTAFNRQPEIIAARIRTQATRWGVEVARLKRRPDLTLSASWFAIDDNRPASNIVSVGEDAWSIGAQISVPLRHQKYDAMQREANWTHAASHASVDETMQRYDALLRDLWAQAKSAHETAQLYRESILPDARQTLSVDTASYSEGSVEFDRVIGNFRTVLMLELEYHRAIGRLATALARIHQATGVELASDGE